MDECIEFSSLATVMTYDTLVDKFQVPTSSPMYNPKKTEKEVKIIKNRQNTHFKYKTPNI